MRALAGLVFAALASCSGVSHPAPQLPPLRDCGGYVAHNCATTPATTLPPVR